MEHPNPSLYQVSLTSNQPFDSAQGKQPSTNNHYLILSQGYDSGWHAFRIQNSEFRIQKFLADAFPFWFGEEIKDHVLVNNWENGWKLQNSEFGIQNSGIINSQPTTNNQQL